MYSRSKPGELPKSLRHPFAPDQPAGPPRRRRPRPRGLPLRRLPCRVGAEPLAGLPLGPTGYGNSPYQCFSAFAGNTLLVSPELLVEQGLLAPGALEGQPTLPEDRVEYGEAFPHKEALLKEAFDNFRRTEPAITASAFEEFKTASAAWLDDYALYRSLKREHDEAAWTEWEAPTRSRDPSALDEARARLSEQIEEVKFKQFLFFDQWTRLREYCKGQQIQIVGDIPIFVAHDSADVWAHPDLFQLNEDGSPLGRRGCPARLLQRDRAALGQPAL